jgi:molybdopterin-containing oxidoreductase family membrane subunit
MYVLIIGGQAYPLEMFPGKEILEGYGELVTIKIKIKKAKPKENDIAINLGAIIMAS